MSTGRQRRPEFSAILLAMAQIDVLPAALVEAAGGVRTFAGEVRDVAPVEPTTGSAELDVAIESFTRASAHASEVVAARADSAAVNLGLSASRYADADDLIPREPR
ncbi:MAG: hypothetical protein KY451_06245 [Actinobacteria bacterium]|nr:hypothetical protein [Actinomycetota bacterium]